MDEASVGDLYIYIYSRSIYIYIFKSGKYILSSCEWLDIGNDPNRAEHVFTSPTESKEIVI